MNNDLTYAAALELLLSADKETLKVLKEKIADNEILSYKEIDQLYGNLEYSNYKTEMFGNMFYIYKLVKKRFGKPKRIDVIQLCCACGVHKQTFIDILKSYGFREVEEDE